MKRSSNKDTSIDRYLAVCLWARKRYTDSQGMLVISIGGQATIYSRIERAAWNKYIA